jgi:3-oxoadipate enol-lactonase / 4-carboxymuconolactone decarboxylase
LHIQAAFRNGVTVAELRELLLHSGIYCGLPAANSAIRIAEEVINESKGGPGSS